MSQKAKGSQTRAMAGKDAADRRGLDLLATTIEEVVEQLPPSKLVSFPPPKPLPKVPRHTIRRRGFALAAILALTVLAWPAYLGLVRLPEVEQQLATARSSLLSAGPVAMTWLSPPRLGGRSAADPPVVRIEKPRNDAFVWLLELPVALRDDLASGARIELRHEVSGRVDEWHLDGEQLARQLAAHDGVPILLSAGELVPGEYQLSWHDETGQVVSKVDIQLVMP